MRPDLIRNRTIDYLDFIFGIPISFLIVKSEQLISRKWFKKGDLVYFSGDSDKKPYIVLSKPYINNNGLIGINSNTSVNNTKNTINTKQTNRYAPKSVSGSTVYGRIF